MDASVMEGGKLLVGAVAAVRNFLHPGRIALDVMRHTPHALLVGEDAEDFALQRGHVPLAPEELVCERERAVFGSWIAAGRPDAKRFFAKAVESLAGKDCDKRDTVGVVVGLRNGEGVWQLYCGTRYVHALHPSLCISLTPLLEKHRRNTGQEKGKSG
jgi:isoaspartyl peptidase/L-asparaginase-like protein (Ntn-hydrolase superfamily)